MQSYNAIVYKELRCNKYKFTNTIRGGSFIHESHLQVAAIIPPLNSLLLVAAIKTSTLSLSSVVIEESKGIPTKGHGIYSIHSTASIVSIWYSQHSIVNQPASFSIYKISTVIMHGKHSIASLYNIHSTVSIYNSHNTVSTVSIHSIHRQVAQSAFTAHTAQSAYTGI
jgi:hypothetical protein